VARARPAIQPPRPAWRWAIAGTVVGVLGGLLLFAPARWLAGAVARATEHRVLLSEPRGTVWSGSANLTVAGGPGSTDAAALPSRVDWRLRPRWDGLRAELHTACCTRQPLSARVRMRWGGASVSLGDVQTHWPASLLSGLGTPWNTLQFEGDLLLATQGLSVEWVQGRLAMAGRAELRAQRLSSRLSTLKPMGSYRITILGGNPPTLQLDTIEGSNLQLSGTGQWVGSRLHFAGTASAAPDREAALSNLLNIIGRRSGASSIITIG
jgi:general secretion pathway protein N